MPVRQCEWCGHDHAVTQLCQARPKWSRRGFIGLLSAAVVGATLPIPSLAFRADAFQLAMDPLSGHNTLVTPEWVTEETARHFVNNLKFLADVNRDYDVRFLVGDKVAVRVPQRFA